MTGLLALWAAAAAAAGPPPESLAAFRAKWERLGRSTAARSAFLRGGRVLVTADPDVDPALVPVVLEAVKAQLAELGAARFSVERADPPPSFSRASCRDGEVLKTRCFARALAVERMGSARWREAVVFHLTNAALDRLPKDLGGGAAEGPPAGSADDREGWMLQSFFYRNLRLKQDPSLGRYGGPAFSRHSLEFTARHELGHLLGLPHHQEIANPGFPEPPKCTACRHAGAGGHSAAPHDECLMFCGAGDDDWFHARSFGRGFGICPKCAAAAAAYLKGVEGR